MTKMPALMALVLMGLAVPLIFNKVPPNAFYGFRTPKTRSSPQLWYAANRAAGLNLTVAAALSLVIWAGIRAMHGAAEANAAGLTVLVVLVLCAFVLSMVQLHRM